MGTASSNWLANAYVRESTVYTSAKGGLVSTTVGTTPFYTNTTNPFNISLNEGETATVTWWVNSTGTINTNYLFFAYANLTSDQAINNKTSIYNITIKDFTSPIINITFPLNITYNVNVNALNYSYIDKNAGSCWYTTNGGESNSSLVNAGINFTGVTSNDDGNTWTLYCNDSSNNIVSDTVLFNKKIPTIGLILIEPTSSHNVGQNQTFVVKVNVTCTQANCGQINVSLDPFQTEIIDDDLNDNPFDDSVSYEPEMVNISFIGDKKDNDIVPLSLITLTDNKSFVYDINDGCSILDGQVDVFDTGLQLQINNSAFTGTRSTTEDNGREAICDPQTKSYLNVSRKVYVPKTEHWARFLEILHNNNTFNICVDVKLFQNMGSDGADFLNTSDHNKSWEVSDHWLMWDDTSIAAGDDAAGFVYQQDDATETVDTVSPVTASGGTNNWVWEDVCVGPGESKILMHFFTQWNSRAESENESTIIYNNFNDVAHTSGMSSDEKSQVVNWNLAQGKDGLVSTTVGATPFYTTSNNPQNISLNVGESIIISWTVNATGTINNSYEFYVYANKTTDPTISNESSHWNVTITTPDVTSPNVTIVSPLNKNYHSLPIYFNLSTNENSTVIYSINNSPNITLTPNASNTGFFGQNGTLANGDYNITFYVNDTVNNPAVVSVVFSSFGFDSDGDNIADLNDTLKGNFNSVNYSGFTKFNLTIAKNSSNGTFVDLQEVNIYDNSTLLINFTHDFSNTSLDLSKVSVEKGDNYIVVNFSGQLVRNKTINFPDNNYVSLCVKDAEISSVNNLSADCNQDNETDFTSCLGGQSTINGIGCSDSGATIKISNLKHSAVRGTQASVSDTSTSAGNSGGGGGQSVSKKEKKVEEIKKEVLECVSDTQCQEDYVCFQNECVKLFDIKIVEVTSPITTDGYLDFTYFIKGMAKINGDVVVNFWLEKDSNKISSGQDVIYLGSFEEKTEKTKIFLPKYLASGNYEFYVQVTFENYQTFSHRTLFVEDGNVELIPLKEESSFNSGLFIIVILFVLLLLLILISVWRKGSYQEKIKRLVKESSINKEKMEKIKDRLLSYKSKVRNYHLKIKMLYLKYKEKINTIKVKQKIRKGDEKKEPPKRLNKKRKPKKSPKDEGRLLIKGLLKAVLSKKPTIPKEDNVKK